MQIDTIVDFTAIKIRVDHRAVQSNTHSEPINGSGTTSDSNKNKRLSAQTNPVSLFMRPNKTLIIMRIDAD